MIRTTGLELHEDSASARPLSTEEALHLRRTRTPWVKQKYDPVHVLEQKMELSVLGFALERTLPFDKEWEYLSWTHARDGVNDAHNGLGPHISKDLYHTARTNLVLKGVLEQKDGGRNGCRYKVNLSWDPFVLSADELKYLSIHALRELYGEGMDMLKQPKKGRASAMEGVKQSKKTVNRGREISPQRSRNQPITI